jgi:hypothetical protein
MHIADRKKQENISEYLIFMYQTEDLIRVYQFDIEHIERYVIKHFPVSETEKKELKGWYQEILRQMQEEGIQERGHLSFLQKIVDKLTALHHGLIDTDQTYEAIYQKAKVHIDNNKELAQGQITSDVQICLNAIYGLLLLRINGKEVDESLQEGLNAFGDLLSYLSFIYKQKNNT